MFLPVLLMRERPPLPAADVNYQYPREVELLAHREVKKYYQLKKKERERLLFPLTDELCGCLEHRGNFPAFARKRLALFTLQKEFCYSNSGRSLITPKRTKQ